MMHRLLGVFVVAAMVTSAWAGPVGVGGFDSDDDGSESAFGADNGWQMARRLLEHMVDGLDAEYAAKKVFVVLGVKAVPSNDGETNRTDALHAMQLVQKIAEDADGELEKDLGVQPSLQGWKVRAINGADDIRDFLAGIPVPRSDAAGTISLSETAIIIIPSHNDLFDGRNDQNAEETAEWGISDAELAALSEPATGYRLGRFVAGGGGLLSFSNGFEWLRHALPTETSVDSNDTDDVFAHPDNDNPALNLPKIGDQDNDNGFFYDFGAKPHQCTFDTSENEWTDVLVGKNSGNGVLLTRNFTQAPPPPGKISGNITGFGAGGATVRLEGPGGAVFAQANGDGSYAFDELEEGAYTVSVTIPGAAVTPSSIMVDSQLDSVSNNDFMSTEILGSISGSIAGDVIEGVRVDLSGPLNLTTSTDAAGNYSFGSLPPGSYIVTPSAENTVFTPSSRQFASNRDDFVALVFNSMIAQPPPKPQTTTGGSALVLMLLVAACWCSRRLA